MTHARLASACAEEVLVNRRSYRWSSLPAVAFIVGALLFLGAAHTACGQDAMAMGGGSADIGVFLEQNRFAVLQHVAGNDSTPLVSLEGLIRVGTPEQRGKIEAWLLAGLEAPDTTPDGRAFIFRMLERVGGDATIAALTPMLTDPATADMARYALERLPSSRVDEAYRAAVSETSGLIRIGIINGLGERGRAENVDTLVALLGDPDAATACAAATALGKTGGEQAVAALAAARQSPVAAVHDAATHAYLVCADRWLAEGHTEEAKALFDDVFATENALDFRAPAFRGRVLTRGDDGVELLIGALRDAQQGLTRLAISLARDYRGPGLAEAILPVLPELAPATKAAVLLMFADRQDKAALPAAVALLDDEDPAIGVAALHVVGTVGDSAIALSLARRVVGDEGERATALRDALARIPGEDVDAAFVAALGDADTAFAVESMGILADRGATSAVPTLVDKAREAEGSVRKAALQALATLAEEDDVPTLLELAQAFSDEGDVAAAMSTLTSVAGRSRGKPETVDCLLSVLAEGVPTSAQCAVIRILPRFPEPKVFQALKQAVQSPHREIQDEAVRSLTEWPTEEVLPVFADMTEHARWLSHRILSFRAYVRLVGKLAEWSPAQKLEALDEALSIAPRVEEKRLVIGALAGLGTQDALRVVAAYLSDPELSKESVAAVLALSAQAASMDVAYVKSVLEKAETCAADPDSRQAVRDILDGLGAAQY